MFKLKKSTEGSVLFVDMRNFTFLCSKMKGNPSENKILKKPLTQYESRFNYIVTQMEKFYEEWLKILQKYIKKKQITNAVFQSTGDGIMIALEGKFHYLAAFEMSVDVADHIRKKLDQEINPKLRKLGINRQDNLLDFGIGVCSGLFSYVEVPHIIGEDGSDKSGKGPFKKGTSVTILGTPANYAAHVEQTTKDHWNSYVLIAEPTIKMLCKYYKISISDTRAVEDKLKVKYLWKHQIKGIKGLGMYMYHIN